MKSIYTCAHCGGKARGYGWTATVPFRVGESGFIVVNFSEAVYAALQVVCRKHFLKPLFGDYEILRGDVGRQLAAAYMPDGSDEFWEAYNDFDVDWGMWEG